MRSRKMQMIGAVSIAVALSAVPASAENVSYTYDALGRLISVTTSGGPNDQTVTTITLDAAGNRTGYKIATAAVPNPALNTPSSTSNPTGISTPSRFIVVPIAGMAIVKLP